MEKLKAKHDHKLTDILKVAIFGLMLILPGLILLPSMLYYGVNEHATAPTEQVEKIEYERVDFNQQIRNGNFVNTDYWITNQATLTVNNNEGCVISSAYFGSIKQQNKQVIQNNKYLLRINVKTSVVNYSLNGGFSFSTSEAEIYYNLTSETANTWTYREAILTASATDYDTNYFIWDTRQDNRDEIYIKDLQLFNLTQMFGSGNEPTIQEFNSWYTDNYYEYTTSRYETLEKPTGTYETYTDITSQIQYNWNSLWQQPLFSWTNYTILKQGLDNFTYVFGITQTSYINNLIVYELIMVAIYIVIDIVLTLFKWLTHLIGEK